MTLTLFSNFLNHHQLPLCQALHKQLGDGFCFVATEPFDTGKVSAGYRDMNTEHSFCLPAYASSAQRRRALELGQHSDVVLSGGVADKWIAARLKENRLTLRVTERPLKPAYASLWNPYTMTAMLWRNTRYRDKNVFLLACGAHVMTDYCKIGAYRGKAYRWGYFPPVTVEVPGAVRERWTGLDATGGAAAKEKPLQLLWVGRMLAWKHPEQVLAVCKCLKEQAIPFHLRFIGDGECQQGLRQGAANMGLQDNVQFCGALPAGQVRQEMLLADMLLFTSDGNEGWGAVVNEAMASGCAVVASALAGAPPSLIADGINGVLYDGTADDLCRKAVPLATDRIKMAALGRQAYATMRDCWNGTVAAERLVLLCQGLLSGSVPTFADGPCSVAN